MPAHHTPCASDRWSNKKDPNGHGLFEGGFLGLDNVGAFDRSQPGFAGARLEQADATAWMAMYCADMLTIALELAQHNIAYEDVASKFLVRWGLTGQGWAPVFKCNCSRRVGALLAH